MTASAGREVHRNRLSRAALGSTLARPQAQDAGRQNLSQLVPALGGGEVD